MKLLYFAWVRERIGKPQEDVELPADVATVGDLMAWLAKRGDEYAHAFENPKVIRAAIDRDPCAPRYGDRGCARDCVLPADDGRLRWPRPSACSVSRSTPPRETAALTRGRTDVGAVVDLHRHLPRRRGGRADRRADARTLSRHGGGRDRPARRGRAARWPLLGVTVIHRYGRARAGRAIVLVAGAPVASPRCVCGAEFLMDFLKTRAPFWKQVELPVRPTGSRPSNPTTGGRRALVGTPPRNRDAAE